MARKKPMMDDKRLAFKTRRLVSRAFEEAWEKAQCLLNRDGSNAISLRAELARRIMAAANAGERDPIRLKRFALTGLGAGVIRRKATPTFVTSR